VASTPAGTASSSPSSSISSLASMRTSPSDKRVSPSGRSGIGGANSQLGDTAALENSSKTATLDTMRGYSQNAYAVVQQTHETETIPRPRARGYQLLREPAWNKGWASILFFIPN
jgi:malate dehydrogenase (oxaloacetate-decarboxylating)(NADP+)